MILLQTGELYGGATSNPTLIPIFFIVVAGIVGLIFLGAVISRRLQPRSAADLQKFSVAVFHKTGKALGLSKAHIDLLEELVRVCKVKQPMLVFSSAGLLDDTLKKGLYSLDTTRDVPEPDKENRRTLIFQIKQIIESNARKGAVLGSTTFLKPGQSMTITPEDGTPFSSKVVSNMRDFLTVAAPALPAGADTRWMRGTRLSVYLWRDNDAGYSFSSKVLGYDTVKGVSSVLIQHSKTLRREQRRRSRRRELLRSCFFYPIRIAETGEGRKAERKAVVEQNLRALGTVVDLSAGGCAVQALNPADKGKLVMIEFDIDKKQPIRAFGKVMYVHRRPGKGGAMNIMFTRVTRQHLNRISEFVYDFARPSTVGQARQQLERASPRRG